MNSQDDKFSGGLKKKRFRSRKNPKHRKFKRRKQRKMYQMQNVTNCWNTGRNRVNYGESFWNNYKRAINWQSSCFESYWRQQSRRLELENISLRQRLTQIVQGCSSSNTNASEETFSESTFEETQEDEDEEEEEESDIEVSEEFMKFIETSLKHKASLAQSKNKEREAKELILKNQSNSTELSEDGLCGAPEEDSSKRRNEEMKQLYGSESPKIQGMETAMHLSFIRKCDKRKPIMWPVLPLSQSFSSNIPN